jgi:hypothetical protein
MLVPSIPIDLLILSFIRYQQLGCRATSLICPYSDNIIFSYAIIESKLCDCVHHL